ncbi:hypothetical protein GCM10029978_046790 [Actinoallomurus acanthiterrae]
MTGERLTADLAALLETAAAAATECEQLASAGSREAELAEQAAAQARARLAQAEQTARTLAALTAEARKITGEWSTREGNTCGPEQGPG